MNHQAVTNISHFFTIICNYFLNLLPHWGGGATPHSVSPEPFDVQRKPIHIWKWKKILRAVFFIVQWAKTIISDGQFCTGEIKLWNYVGQINVTINIDFFFMCHLRPRASALHLITLRVFVLEKKQRQFWKCQLPAYLTTYLPACLYLLWLSGLWATWDPQHHAL